MVWHPRDRAVRRAGVHRGSATFTYTPSPNDAYAKSKRSREIWIGALIRNMHHWSGNLLLIVSALHLLRGFTPPRFTTRASSTGCWGWRCWGLVALSNFTAT